MAAWSEFLGGCRSCWRAVVLGVVVVLGAAVVVVAELAVGGLPFRLRDQELCCLVRECSPSLAVAGLARLAAGATPPGLPPPGLAAFRRQATRSCWRTPSPKDLVDPSDTRQCPLSRRNARCPTCHLFWRGAGLACTDSSRPRLPRLRHREAGALRVGKRDSLGSLVGGFVF